MTVVVIVVTLGSERLKLFFFRNGFSRKDSGTGGTEMKNIIVVAKAIIVLILLIICLQGCFTPYPAQGTPERAIRDREVRESMRGNMLPW